MDRLTWKDRTELLREKKVRHTQEKIEQNGYMDVDDYGTVPLPDDFNFEPVPNHDNGGFYGYKANARNYRKLLEEHPVYVDSLEILCGRWREMLNTYRKGWPEDLFPYDDLKSNQKLYDLDPGIGSLHHFAGDYQIGLDLGWQGLLEKVRYYKEKQGEDKREFYEAEEEVIIAIQNWIKRHIEKIKSLLEEEDRPEIRETLQKMLECNQHIVHKPPETFLQACQWMAWMATVSRIYNRDGAGCRLDVCLLPYYERDKKAGRLDDEEATFILANLLLIDPQYYQLSGPDKKGNDVTNKVSYLVLDAAHWLDSTANITVRYHDDIDPEFFHKSVKYLFEDRNGWPRFAGNKGLINFKKNEGVDQETARNRIAVGCNWMAVPGKEYCINDCIKINIARVFDVAFQEMMDETEPSMDNLWDKFKYHLKQAVETIAAGVNLHLEHQAENVPELILNLIMEDTIERGEDISRCAQLYTIGVDGVGLGTVADSFAALEQRIIKEKRTSWEEVYNALNENFEGKTGERLKMMLKKSENYCQGISLGDKWAGKVSNQFTKNVKEQSMPGKRQLVPGWFSWSKTIEFGEAVGATPNGRKKGEPVTHGANPVPGFREDGASTAMATGIARIQPGYGNPAPLQLEMDPRLSVEEGGLERVKQLLKTHFEKEGTLININIVDKETIMEAQENPELYPDLVVRVTGFTAYFIALSPEFRQLVVNRFVEGF